MEDSFIPLFNVLSNEAFPFIGRSKQASVLSKNGGISTKDYERTAAEQFVAEPDDLTNFDQDVLQELHRGMIKEYDNSKQNPSPNAFRYINDDQSLSDIQKNIFKKFNQAPSNNVPNGIRYINEAAELAMEGIMDKLNKILYIKGMERSHIKTQSEEDSTDKKYFDDKTSENVKHKNGHLVNLNINDMNHDKGQTSSAKLINVSSFHMHPKANYRAGNKRKIHKAKINTNKIRTTGPYSKTSGNSKDKQPHQKKGIPSHKRIKATRNKHSALYLSKSPANASVGLAKMITDKDKELHKKADNIVKREVYRSANEPTNENDDERIKKGSIFSDIATAFKHIQQDQESKYKTKKSDLEKATKKPGKYIKRPCFTY